MTRLQAQELVDELVDIMVRVASLKGVPQYKKDQMMTHLSNLIEILGGYE